MMQAGNCCARQREKSARILNVFNFKDVAFIAPVEPTITIEILIVEDRDMPAQKSEAPGRPAGKIEFNPLLLQRPKGAELLRDRALVEFVFLRPKQAGGDWYRLARRKLYRLKENDKLPVFYPTPRSMTAQRSAICRWFQDVVRRGNRPERHERKQPKRNKRSLPVTRR
jgi:hypothetical protein